MIIRYLSLCQSKPIFSRRKLNVPLLLENSPDSNEEHEVFDIYPQVESEFITKFVEHNDTDFLLDIAHAKVAALYRGWDIKEYIFKLPLERCKRNTCEWHRI